MNIIGIDPSINSTGMTINGEVYNFSNYETANNKNSLKKWYKIAEENIDITYIEYSKKNKTYQENEILKLIDYNKTVGFIIKKIKENIDIDLKTTIGIESYSYGSNYGDIIDLVTFSTLLRNRIYNEITTNLIIIPPSTLKLSSAILTYIPKEIGKRKKKLIYENNAGMKGGNFTKREMYLAIIENDNINSVYHTFLTKLKDDILEIKTIQKPIEDCNDSYLIYQILKNNIIK